MILPKDGTVSTPGKSGPWVDISAKVLQTLENEGKKIGYPGMAAGMPAVHPAFATPPRELNFTCKVPPA